MHAALLYVTLHDDVKGEQVEVQWYDAAFNIWMKTEPVEAHGSTLLIAV